MVATAKLCAHSPPRAHRPLVHVWYGRWHAARCRGPAAKSLRQCGYCELLPAASFCPAAVGAAWAASNGTGTQGAGVNVLVFEKLLRSLCNWKGPVSVVGLSAAISSTAPQPGASTVIARNPRTTTLLLATAVPIS